MYMLFIFYRYGDHRDLHVLTHSFPTRRYSDIELRSGIDLAIRYELAERDEARIHMAATVVELDRVDRAELRAGQFGDEDVVVAVERFGAAARPVDPQGAADAIDDRGLVDDLRTGDRRPGDRKSTRLNSRP